MEREKTEQTKIDPINHKNIEEKHQRTGEIIRKSLLDNKKYKQKN